MDLTMTRGDTASWQFPITVDEVPFDLTDVSATFTVKRHVDDDDQDAIARRTIGDGVTIDDAAGGLLTVKMAVADTDGLAIPTTFAWDLELRRSGDVLTVASGSLTVGVDVGRSAP